MYYSQNLLKMYVLTTVNKKSLSNLVTIAQENYVPIVRLSG